MRLTLKSIITTISYICTLATAGYLCIVATAIYLYHPDSSVKIPHDRLQQLSESYSSLNHNIAFHQTHVTGPFTKALLDQMTAVKTQVSDLLVDLGCAEQKGMEDVCYVLKAEELRLRIDIVTKRIELYLDVEEKEVEKYKAVVERELLFE